MRTWGVWLDGGGRGELNGTMEVRGRTGVGFVNRENVIFWFG